VKIIEYLNLCCTQKNTDRWKSQNFWRQRYMQCMH